jgi:hypothetical protein
MNDSTIIKPSIGNRGFGRRIAHDLRDANFPAKRLAMPPLAAIDRISKYWYKNPSHLPMDQGATPQCVAFSAETLLYCGPVVNTKDPDPRALYHLAQELDEWEGEDYDGTSVRAGQKALQQLGFIQSYLWATTAQEAAAFLLTHGPVVFGTAWTDSMMEPVHTLGDFWLKVDRAQVNDQDVAGHAYCIAGVHTEKQCPDGTKGAFQIINSWGHHWGEHGRVWLSMSDADALLAASGECALPTEIKVQ